MRSPDVRVLVHKASTGTPLAEVPLTDLSWSRTLVGTGALSGSIPVWHPLATEDIWGQHRNDPDREITVFVDGDADWNGPLTGTSATLVGGSLQINAREASWYLLKRTMEENRDYTGWDAAAALDDLEDYTENKEATGDDGMTLGADIIAALPRFSWDTSDLVGVTLGTAVFAGAGRHTIQQILEFLAADPQTGFEWRMDYRTSSTRQSPHRTLTFGHPGLGDTLTAELSERRLSDYGRDLDWERAGTRFHVLYQGGVVTRQSATAVGNSVLLTEVVDDYTDTSNKDFAIGRAKDLRRLSRPAVRVPSAVFRPSTSLPHDFCDLGDTVPFEITWPDILTISADIRRVIEIDKSYTDGDLSVALTFNDRLDDLGA